MVQFGVYLDSFRNPAWAERYLSYRTLKDLIYDLQKEIERRKESKTESSERLPEGKAFEAALDENLEKIDQFYSQKIQDLTDSFQVIKSKLEGDGQNTLTDDQKEEIKQEFHRIYVELNLLRDFSNLNYTGFSKILKKHDKLIPDHKMKKEYFKEKVNKKAVFGILDSLYTLQYQVQSLYSEYFEEFNRIDTEISFGEALAKATGDIARFTSLENRKNMMKKGIFNPAYQMGVGGEFMVPEFQKEKQKKPEILESALWQRARLTVMAANAFGSQKDSLTRQLILGLILVMVGGIGQSLFLEYMVRIDPGCGSTITFFSFLFITLQGFRDFTYQKLPLDAEGKEIPATTLWQKIQFLRMKPLKIPLMYHAGCVLMSWFSAVLSAQAFSYGVSVPFHMVFKSGILLVNMCIGMIVLKKRYTLSQAGSVLMVTLGVLFSTLASLPKNKVSHAEEKPVDLWDWFFGLSILALSLVFTGFLGILQDLSYRKFGQHWQEALFYAHFLGLPLFLSLGFEIFEHINLWWTKFPIMWTYLILNIVTTFLGVNGVYKVTGLTSSLTGNLTITVRKFISLLISVIYFKNDFTLLHWLGAIGVLLGTTLYTQASQNAVNKQESSKKKD